MSEGLLDSRPRHYKRPSDVFWFVKNVYSTSRPKLRENESIWTLDFFFPGISSKYSFMFLQGSLLTHQMLWRRREWQDRKCSGFTASFGSHLVQPLNVDNTCAFSLTLTSSSVSLCLHLSITIFLTSYHTLCLSPSSLLLVSSYFPTPFSTLLVLSCSDLFDLMFSSSHIHDHCLSSSKTY